MKFWNDNLGSGKDPAGTHWHSPACLADESLLVASVGPVAKLLFCLAAGLALFASSASAQLSYAVEFNQTENYFGTINLLNGAFTPLGSEGGTLFNDIAAASDGTVYGIVSSSSLVTLNPANGGILSSVSFSVSGIESLAIAPNGTLYGASQNALYTIDPVSGQATLVGDFDNSQLNNAGQNIRFAADGNLYDTDGGVDAMNTDLFQISLANGYATTEGVITNFPGLCLENAGQIMYGAGIQLGSASTLVQDLMGIDLTSLVPGGINPNGSIADINYVLVTTNFPNNYNFSSPFNYIVPGTPIYPAPEPGVSLSFVVGAIMLVVFNQRRQIQGR